MKILIIRFSSIGDIVLTTPIVRALKQQVPHAEIHYLTKPGFKSVVENNPYIHRVWVWESPTDSLFKQLKQEQFNWVIDLHHNLRSFRVKLALQTPQASFAKLNWEKWLMVRFKINRLPDTHIVDRYREAASSLTIFPDMQGLDYFIPEKDEVSIETISADCLNGYVALVIGAMHATKRLPKEKLLELLTRISKPIILLGGKDDQPVADWLMQHKLPHVYNACGRYNLNQSASLVKQARVVITHDTGLMHIAAAFQKSIISVWGNTIPEFGMYPYLPQKEAQAYSYWSEVKGLACRPCSKIGHDACPKGHFKCMQEQDLQAIAQKVQQWWNR